MRRTLFSAVAVVGVILLTAGCSGSKEPEPEPVPSVAPAVPTPVIASALAEPIPVRGSDGLDHLAYELMLTNTLDQQVTLTSVTVKADDRPLLTLSGRVLTYWTRVLGKYDKPTAELGPGQSAIVWLDVAVQRPQPGSLDGGQDEERQDTGAAIPDQLTHSIGVSLSRPQPPMLPATLTEDVATVPVQSRTPVVIAPPLTGARWLDANGCCDMTPHRMATNSLNGGLWAAERFAIDYVQLGADGRIFSGDKAKPESYPYFGAEIRAVADGPVVAVVDGLPEQVAGRSPSGLPLDQYAGNHIVQDIGDGNYALYAHLKTDSIQVEEGDRLERGQVFAALGNSGNTDAPHLHFHVMSTPEPLHSDGLPFVISSFTLEGRLTSQDAVDPLLDGEPARLQPGFGSRAETDVSPLVLDVMTYADG